MKFGHSSRCCRKKVATHHKAAIAEATTDRASGKRGSSEIWTLNNHRPTNAELPRTVAIVIGFT
jgi:hypothetical protein